VIRRLAGLIAAGLIAAAVLVALATAPAASAHATRVATDPADNATLSSSPTRVSATFNEALQSAFAALTIVGPDGNLWNDGDPTVQGAVLSAAVRPLGPTGVYTVNYRVTSADGHVVSGSWSFQLTVAGSGTPGPPAAAAAPSGGGIPVWPFVAVAAAVIAGGTWWAVRRRG
jgi:copper resistance protein C